MSPFWLKEISKNVFWILNLNPSIKWHHSGFAMKLWQMKTPIIPSETYSISINIFSKMLFWTYNSAYVLGRFSESASCLQLVCSSLSIWPASSLKLYLRNHLKLREFWETFTGYDNNSWILPYVPHNLQCYNPQKTNTTCHPAHAVTYFLGSSISSNRNVIICLKTVQD